MIDTDGHVGDLGGIVTGPIEIIACHAEGEVGDVVVSGVAVPPGATIIEQSQCVFADGRLRQMLLNEPRGGVFRHVNLLVPAVDPSADIGFIIMEPMDNPLMSGSNSMCVATVVLETGIVKMVEPATTVRLEAPAGIVEAVAQCRDGKVTSVSIRNVESFAAARDVMLEVEGHGTLRVDTAFGGDSFVMVDAADLGIEITPANGADLARLGSQLTRAANEQLGFNHPTLDWNHFSFCQIAGSLASHGAGRFSMTNTVVVEPGKLDRSPTGTGVSARMALFRARGVMQVGDELVMRSVIGSEFVGRIDADAIVGSGSDSIPAIVPIVTGRAWRYGRFTHELDPTDPYPFGYRVTDTWPA
ncbi:MAG: proline racemase [Candidatus Aldehydirespiratoraceae bacterium]|jgi:proline racemase